MTEGIEKQVSNFEQKVKDDSLKAFTDILASFKIQTEQARKIADDVKKQRGILANWAEKAHYRVNWDKFTVVPFDMVGDCKRCSKKNVGLIAYNDHGCNVCESCNESLEREFEDEYR